MSEITKVTREGYDKLVQEHEYLVTVRRKEIAEQIKQARGFGDLTENSEYDEAMDAQGKLEARIKELDLLLKDIQVVEDSDTNPNVVSIGKKVKIKFADDGEVEEYEIVGATEADIMNNRISYESPLGKAINNQKADKRRKIPVDAPSGRFDVIILEVKKAK